MKTGSENRPKMFDHVAPKAGGPPALILQIRLSTQAPSQIRRPAHKTVTKATTANVIATMLRPLKRELTQFSVYVISTPQCLPAGMINNGVNYV